MPDDPSPSSSSLPDEIVQSIAIANATSVGSQPAVLANLALANQIFNQNLQQQMAIANQQAINLITAAVVGKCVSLLTSDRATVDPQAVTAVKELIQTLGSLQPAAPAVPPPPPAATA